MPFRKFFTAGIPQRPTKMESRIQGSHALDAEGRTPATEAGVGATTVDRGAALETSFGFHTRMKATSARIDAAALTMSTSQGP
jgi:hypothetical protein